jgi:hypothetical protein
MVTTIMDYARELASDSEEARLRMLSGRRLWKADAQPARRLCPGITIFARKAAGPSPTQS